MRAMLRKCLGIAKSDCHSCTPDDEPEPTSIKHSNAFDINKAQVNHAHAFTQRESHSERSAPCVCLAGAHGSHGYSCAPMYTYVIAMKIASHCVNYCVTFGFGCC